MKISGLFLIILLVSACTSKKQESTTAAAQSNAVRNILPQLAVNLEKHGGLSTWDSFGSLSFTNGDNKHILNLRNRNEVFKKDSAYTVGYNADQVWIMPDSSAHPRAKFYRNLYFYFFALPFVGADAGVNHEYLGQKNFNGVDYDLVKLSYDENIGDSPEDRYILYINSETKQLYMINYSVTYFDKSKSESYNALVYTGWQTVNGLLVPTGFDGYVWENDTLGAKRYEAGFTDVLFEKETPSPSVFEAPEGAFIPSN